MLFSKTASSLKTSIVKAKAKAKDSMNDMSDEAIPKDNGSNPVVKDFHETSAGSPSQQTDRISRPNDGEASDSASFSNESTSLKLEQVSSSLSKFSSKSDESEECIQRFQAG